ncbi:hypothetical protein BDA96_01G026700 [Sorghum bicolor]|uniref:Uncharacterized protein n=1 Tax=Sorghum bicolor TaxID=4558 RepID=A0A921UW73_SORBI|nr:hypothetical protein BDA96_01G026700 [Sorghum bicolor]
MPHTILQHLGLRLANRISPHAWKICALYVQILPLSQR